MFGEKKDKAPTTGEAIQKLRETENMLIKKQEFLESKIEEELNIAKKNASKNKRVALQALKKKKRLEKQLQQIDGTLSTIEMQREALESANTNTAVLTTMKDAADALKSAHKNMDVDKVHDMMDDIAEQQDVAREISDAISNPVAFGADIDDEDLERELDELEQENFDKEIIGIPEPSSTLPEVPGEELPEKAEKKKAPAASSSTSARIYDSKYWKEQCFALTAELLVDKAMELRFIGGVYGGNIKPTQFLCLTLKMLQIQPEKDIVVEFIKNEEFKYVRALGAFYLRLTGSAVDCYKYLEPLYIDNRKIRRRNRNGQFEIVYMDDFIDELLRSDRVCDIILPRIQKRFILEENNELDPKVSALEEDFEEEPASEDEALNTSAEGNKDDKLKSLQDHAAKKRVRRDRSRSASRERDRERRGARTRDYNDDLEDYNRQRERYRDRDRDRDVEHGRGAGARDYNRSNDYRSSRDDYHESRRYDSRDSRSDRDRERERDRSRRH